MVVITANQRDVIFDAVRTLYTELALHPDGPFHFASGRAGCEGVGYPSDLLDALPPRSVESFAGVGYPFAAEAIGEGDVVLDVGSGSGTDVFAARRLAGAEGEVIGLDMTEAMREKLRGIARDEGASNIRVVEGGAESIPLPDGSVDVVTSNGVLNLVPGKETAIVEIFRVLRPGGRVQIADIVLGEEPSDTCRANPRLWAECIVGATTEAEYLGHFRNAGFEDVERLSTLDYFGLSPDEKTRHLAAEFGAVSIVLRARKP